MKYRGYMYRFCAIHYIPPHLHDVFLGEKTISTPLFVGANPRKSRIFIPREETSHDVEQLAHSDVRDLPRNAAAAEDDPMLGYRKSPTRLVVS